MPPKYGKSKETGHHWAQYSWSFLFFISTQTRGNLESALFDTKYKNSKRNDEGESFDAKEAWKMCLVLILLRS